MTREERYKGIIQWFEQNMPEAQSELQYGDPYQLLAAVMLSAQCTDKRVNMTTPALFERFPTVESMAVADADQIYPYIKSISYPNNKAKNLAAMARGVVERFEGHIPDSIEALESLKGVGHKTANVVAAVVFHRNVMPVDTHVFRVSARIGLTVGAKTPRQTEQQLVANIPEEKLPSAHHWLILHGRYMCTARKPKCDQCGITRWCAFFAQSKAKANNIDK